MVTANLSSALAFKNSRFHSRLFSISLRYCYTQWTVQINVKLIQIQALKILFIPKITERDLQDKWEATTKLNSNTQFPTEWRNRLALLEIRKISASIWIQLGLDNYHWSAAVLYLNLCNQFASIEETKCVSPATTRVTQHSYHLTTDRILCPICQLLWVNTRLGLRVHPRWVSLLVSLFLSQQHKYGKRFFHTTNH